jgi:hypothetical protein
MILVLDEKKRRGARRSNSNIQQPENKRLDMPCTVDLIWERTYIFVTIDSDSIIKTVHYEI